MDGCRSRQLNSLTLWIYYGWIGFFVSHLNTSLVSAVCHDWQRTTTNNRHHDNNNYVFGGQGSLWKCDRAAGRRLSGSSSYQLIFKNPQICSELHWGDFSSMMPDSEQKAHPRSKLIILHYPSLTYIYLFIIIILIACLNKVSRFSRGLN